MASISKQSKETQDRHRKMLAELLKRPENQECMDCRARNPTWASINLGVFVCIRCSGLHRQVGVHITQVRSCTMDLWEPHQIANMQAMGNAKGRAIYEALLPPDYGKPAENEDSQMVLQWIRTKYEKKRYYSATPLTATASPASRPAGAPAEARSGDVAVPLRPSKAKKPRESKPLSVMEAPVSSEVAPSQSPVGYTFDQFMSPSVQSPRGETAPSFDGVGSTTGASAFSFLNAANNEAASQAASEPQRDASAFGFIASSLTPPPTADDDAPPVVSGSSAFGFIAASAPVQQQPADQSPVQRALPADSLLVFDAPPGPPPMIPGHFLSPVPPEPRNIVFDPFASTAASAPASVPSPTQQPAPVTPALPMVAPGGIADPQAMLAAMQQQMAILQQQLALAQLVNQGQQLQ